MHDPATLGAPAHARAVTACFDGELRIEMYAFSKRVVYRGTRDALLAEGLVPRGRDWTRGLGEMATWCDEKFRLNLVRERPPGAKGPRRAFQDVDWWRLSVCLREPSVDYASVAVARKKAELAALEFWQSSEGVRVAERFCVALRDRAFQEFRAKIPVLNATRRRRSAPRGAEGHSSVA